MRSPVAIGRMLCFRCKIAVWYLNVDSIKLVFVVFYATVSKNVQAQLLQTINCDKIFILGRIL